MRTPHRPHRQGGRRLEADPATGSDRRRMKRAVFILVCVVSTISAAPKEKPNSNAGGVVINPSEGEVAPGDELTITFPAAMVSPDKIDMANQACPFVSQPPMEGDFLWKR